MSDNLRDQIIAVLIRCWPGWESQPERDAPGLADDLLSVVQTAEHGIDTAELRWRANNIAPGESFVRRAEVIALCDALDAARAHRVECPSCAADPTRCATARIKCCPECTGVLHQTFVRALRAEQQRDDASARQRKEQREMADRHLAILVELREQRDDARARLDEIRELWDSRISRGHAFLASTEDVPLLRAILDR